LRGGISDLRLLRRIPYNPQLREGAAMRGIFLLLAPAALLYAGGCHGLWRSTSPQPASLPVAHQLRVEQLVFHSDFDLPREHRLVRELVDEREAVYRTLGLPPSDEPIEVYLFHDVETYRQFLMRYFPSVPSR